MGFAPNIQPGQERFAAMEIKIQPVVVLHEIRNDFIRRRGPCVVGGVQNTMTQVIEEAAVITDTGVDRRAPGFGRIIMVMIMFKDTVFKFGMPTVDIPSLNIRYKVFHMRSTALFYAKKCIKFRYVLQCCVMLYFTFIKYYSMLFYATKRILPLNHIIPGTRRPELSLGNVTCINQFRFCLPRVRQGLKICV